MRNALVRFDQVEDVSDTDRELAFANIKKAAEYFDVDVEETSWRDLSKRPRTRNPANSSQTICTLCFGVAMLQRHYADHAESHHRAFA